MVFLFSKCIFLVKKIDKTTFIKKLAKVVNGCIDDDELTDSYDVRIKAVSNDDGSYLFVSTRGKHGLYGVSVLKEKEPQSLLRQEFDDLCYKEWDVSGYSSGFFMYRYGIEIYSPDAVAEKIVKEWPDLFEKVEIPSFTLELISFVAEE